MTLTAEFEQEDEGCWIAEVVDLPGVMVYGATREEALARVKSLALVRVADLVEHDELELDGVIQFVVSPVAA